jgi:hypothetical protein
MNPVRTLGSFLFILITKLSQYFKLTQLNQTTTSTSTSKAATTPSPSSDSHWDVFRHNFRGEDMCKNFVDHLYYALMRAKIHTFQDDKELPRVVTISTELTNAIQG